MKICYLGMKILAPWKNHGANQHSLVMSLFVSIDLKFDA